MCSEVGSPGRSCGVTVLLALSAVIGCLIYSFWPPLSGSGEPSPLSHLLVGRYVDLSQHPVYVMWSMTRLVPSCGEVVINHSVPQML